MMPSWSPAPPPPGAQPSAGYPQYSLAPAYTPVQVRQAFSAPFPPPANVMQSTQTNYGQHSGYAVSYPTAPSPAQANQTQSYSENGTPSAPEPAKKKVDWPLSVRSYVQRSFLPANMDPSVTRPEMEAKLKETISHANEAGIMYSIDWDNMPLPQQMIRDERASALTTSSASRPSEPKPQHQHQHQESRTSGNSSANPRKRKSNEFAEDDSSSSSAPPPWRRQAPLEDRVTFSPNDKRQAPDESQSKSKLQKQMEKRQRRFEGGYKSTYQRSPSPDPSNVGPVVGTCETLEKRYLRLTSAPNPAQVRPERILRQTLELLKKKWRKEGNYSYICDQFKSMRQDLTVQRIKNDFTVSVYEIHARIALEKGDLGEYNQCQTQLKALYQLGLKGNPIEFKAYRILYFIHTANRAALNDAIKDLTAAEKREPPIKHALDVRSSLALGNYHRFFQLYLNTPKMGAYLMDMFVRRERLAALCNICKAYKPDVRLRFITEELGFESDADAAQFIIDYDGQQLLEERDDHIVFLSGKAGLKFEEPRRAAFSKVDIKGQI